MDRKQWEKWRKDYQALILEQSGENFYYYFDCAEIIQTIWPGPITTANVDQAIRKINKAGYSIAIVREPQARREYAYQQEQAKAGKKVQTEKDLARKQKSHHRAIRQNLAGQKNFIGGPGNQKDLFDAT